MTGKQEYYEAATIMRETNTKIYCARKSHYVPYVLFLIRKQAKPCTERHSKDTQMILVGLAAKPGEFTALR